MIRAAALVGALAAWALVAYGNRALGLMNPVLVPTPGEVVDVAVTLARDGSLAHHLAVSSLRIGEGFGLAIFVIVGAEFMGADAGLGNLIMEGRVFFNPAQIVMGALLLGVLGSLANALLLATERRVLRWRVLR